MKKIAILLLVMFVAVGVVMAQEGLYAGAEIGVDDFEAAADTIGVMPYIGYAAEVIENLELSAELTLPMTFEPDFILAVGLELGVQYSVGLDFGSLYFGLALPMGIISTEEDAEFFGTAELNFTAGLETESGFGIEVTLYNSVRPINWVESLEIYPYYGMDALYFGLCIGIPLVENGIKYSGLDITPEVGYSLNENLELYGRIPISGVGAESGSPSIGLTIGVKYSF